MAGQVWAVNSLGGYMYSRQLSNVLRLKKKTMICVGYARMSGLQ